MANDIDLMKQAHELLDPLMDGGILSKERSDGLSKDLAQFLTSVRAEGMPTDETFWQQFQQLFDFAHCDPVITPMNAANLCPEPRILLEMANSLRLEYNRNVSQQMRTARGERVVQLERARKLLADGLKLGSQNDLAIVRNASEGNNAINCGYRRWLQTTNPAERENAVLWVENHPTNLEAWRLRAEWGRPANNPLFDIRLIRFESNASEEFISQAFTSQINARTRFVSFSETANSTGFRIPEGVIRNIWEYVRQVLPNCHVHIDGTMAWGARHVDLSNPLCHSFVSSAHKWFLGPKETGILYMAPDKVHNFVPSIFAYDYKITVPDKWQDMPNNALRFEMIGQRDDVNIITLAWTQMMWDVLEERKPDERVSELAQYLMQKLVESDWELITPQDPTRSWGVVRVKAEQGGRPKSLYDWLYDNMHIAGSGNNETFRLCPHIYNTLADIDRAVEGMNTWRTLRS